MHVQVKFEGGKWYDGEVWDLMSATAGQVVFNDGDSQVVYLEGDIRQVCKKSEGAALEKPLVELARTRDSFRVSTPSHSLELKRAGSPSLYTHMYRLGCLREGRSWLTPRCALTGSVATHRSPSCCQM